MSKPASPLPGGRAAGLQPDTAPPAKDQPPMNVTTESIAIELLKSKDRKIAEAARRVFAAPPTASASEAPMPPPPAPTGRPASSIEIHTHGGRGPTGFAKTLSNRKSPTVSPGPAEVTSRRKRGTTDPSTAASALTAMAFSATATATAAAVAPPRNSGRKYSSSERLQRSRERNRMHARKTRQRKKEHMHVLQDRVAELKREQLRLRQVINEKATASILLGMFGKAAVQDEPSSEDPEVDALMKRPVEEIPDASKIPELPALILPGQHSSKKIREAAAAASAQGEGAVGGASSSLPQHAKLPDDGIDYELLSKDRSKCTPAELDQIRRERNRMHAKRTRDRKRIFMEEMEVMISQLEGENQILANHLASLDGSPPYQKAAATGGDDSSAVPGSSSTSSSATPAVTPSVGPVSPHLQPAAAPPLTLTGNYDSSENQPRLFRSVDSNSAAANRLTKEPASRSGITVDQIKTILTTAGELDKNASMTGMLTMSSVASAVSAHNSDGESEDEHRRPNKRQRGIDPSKHVQIST